MISQQTQTTANEFDGVFGMSNLDKLASLKMSGNDPKKDAKIEVNSMERNGKTIPTHIHFENAERF